MSESEQDEHDDPAGQDEQDEAPSPAVVGLAPVEAVFVWHLNSTNWRAVYGRIGKGPSPRGRSARRSKWYTKDFLQVSGREPGTTAHALGRILGLRADAQQLPLVYRWPGGGASRGALCKAVDYDTDGRLNLRWYPTSNGPSTAPFPWQPRNIDVSHLGTTVNATLTDESAADGELERLQALGLKGCFLAIKLVGDPSLHARFHVERPGAQPLPPEVRSAVDRLGPKKGADFTEYSETPPAAASPQLLGLTARQTLARIRQAVSEGRNVLLTGPPGCGKTILLETLQTSFETAVGFDPLEWEGWFSNPNPMVNRRVQSLVFHPSYTHEDFVASLLPQTNEAGGLVLTATPGPLVFLAHWARGSGTRRALLLIDEFNRGNAAAIFGSTLALLDQDKREHEVGTGARIVRPYSHTPMRVPLDYTNEAGGVMVDDLLTLPRNVAIVAAFNSSDRSVAPLDAALRRRFIIVRVGPELSALAARLSVILPAIPTAFETLDPATWTIEQARELAVRVLEGLNRRIEHLLGEDFLLGPSVFWAIEGGDPESIVRSIAQAFDEQVAQTLRLTFLDQEEELAAVLQVGEDGGQTRVGTWIDPPESLARVGVRRLRLHRLSSLGDWRDAARAMARLTT